ncbi:hypothetical protein CP556_14120 [Natrinema sp. CBA1119]|uniref:hypothetical protein n=1 Tax=Natrinema sp. CBA1119 TaxID=1608465 RepID=UPI000BFA747C|nr:hypothetical protein [Natrinema sp. CBA1119]PGF17143.1 hypothetical protein CP556_14120 [Natrinema sp. CBA1119]
MDLGTTRRDVLGLVGVGSIATIAGCSTNSDTGPEEPETEEAATTDHKSPEPIDELVIKSGKQYTVADEESYDAVRWEQTGSLALETDAELELEEIST